MNIIPSRTCPTHGVWLAAVAFAVCSSSVADEGVDYAVKLTTVTSGWDGKKCWVHSRAGAIPARSPGNPSDTPIVVMTTQKLRITGSDIFDGLHDFRTADLGAKWTGPVAHASLDRRPMGDGVEAAPCDFTPQWHARTGKLLGTGKTFWYKNDEHFRGPPSDAVYSVYDPDKRSWSGLGTCRSSRSAPIQELLGRLRATVRFTKRRCFTSRLLPPDSDGCSCPRDRRAL